MHIDVPDTLPQCPEVREYVNIEPLLSEADKKLLAETECDKGESLLERIAEGNCAVYGQDVGLRIRRAASGCVCCQWIFNNL